MGTCTCFLADVCIYVCMLVNNEWRLTLGAFINFSPSFVFFKTRSHWTGSSRIQLEWLIKELQDLSGALLLRLEGRAPCQAFYVSPGDQNSESHVMWHELYQLHILPQNLAFISMDFMAKKHGFLLNDFQTFPKQICFLVFIFLHSWFVKYINT